MSGFLAKNCRAARQKNLAGEEALSRPHAFTLVELLMVIAVIAILAGLLLPTLARSKSAAQSIQCANSLHQFGLAAQMYWDDNAGKCFAYQGPATNGGYVYWFGWLQDGAEGHRAFDATQGALYPYTKSTGIDVCPAFNYLSPQFKLKATGASYGYGYNLSLSPLISGPPINVHQLTRPGETVSFADAAQINTFQAPASPTHPMIEEFYYVKPTEATAHFRHRSTANVLFCDSHVGREIPVPDSLDQRIPSANIGKLRKEILTLP